MRLIDVDELIKQVIDKLPTQNNVSEENGYIRPFVDIGEVYKGVCEIPTVYDENSIIAYGAECYKKGKEEWIEKVVEKLDNAESIKIFGSLNSGNRLIPVKDAIDIVKAGVKNE